MGVPRPATPPPRSVIKAGRWSCTDPEAEFPGNLRPRKHCNQDTAGEGGDQFAGSSNVYGLLFRALMDPGQNVILPLLQRSLPMLLRPRPTLQEDPSASLFAGSPHGTGNLGASRT